MYKKINVTGYNPSTKQWEYLYSTNAHKRCKDAKSRVFVMVAGVPQANIINTSRYSNLMANFAKQ